MNFNNFTGPIKYTSDPHLGHANIIKYCDRPFKDTAEMNYLIWSRLVEADQAGFRLVILGDIFFKGFKDPFEQFPALSNRHKHLILFGNHDKYTTGADRDKYLAYADTLVGNSKTWRTHTAIITDTCQGKPIKVLLSHEPQQGMKGCNVNIYGHHHNNMTRFPEKFKDDYPWLLKSIRHANVGVELHDYRPVSLDQLFPGGIK